MDNINLNRENGQKLWAADWNKLVSTINLIIDTVNNLSSGTEITKLSQLINDSGFITESDISGKADKSELADVATSGSYNDLLDKPVVIGEQGPAGKSAYLIAVDNGFVGTQQEWLATLKGEEGDDGVDGKSAYELYVASVPSEATPLTESQWLASLNGSDGQPGQDGADGLNGADGQDGLDGSDGKSAYELAVELGYEGTLELWLESLHGQDGTNGLNGTNGKSAYLSYLDTTTDNPVLTELLWANNDYNNLKNKPTIPIKISDLLNDSEFLLVNHDYVEIGGRKWATMNIGASTVTDTGLYFQWGDTSGYTASQVGSDNGKKFFYWDDYKYCDGTSSVITKYNSTDDKIVLDASDDAAHIAWGGNWRMPTKEEFLELRNAVTTEWVTNYQGSGVAGLVCTDKTDSSKMLFFPAAGECGQGSVYPAGIVGFYYSSSRYNLYCGYELYFSNSNVDWINYSYRFNGQSVRAILDDNLNNTPKYASKVAITGDYNDLLNKPTIPAALIQADWNQSDSNALDYIKNKPTIPTLGSSGTQVQADWNQTDSTQVDYIKNKPTITNGKSAYLSYVDTTSDNPILTEQQWIASLHGTNGTNGTNGTDGVTPHIDSTSKHWMIGSTDTGILAEGLNGTDGTNGTNGSDGHTPVITASKSNGVTIILSDGTTIATINDGSNGSNGQNGHTPTITASKSNGVTTIAVDGTDVATINDGNNISPSPYLSFAPKAVTGSSYTYVDLGLPSGTLWATKNIGASDERDDGLFFSWGNIEGYANPSSSVEDYSLTTGAALPGSTLSSGIPANASFDAAVYNMNTPWRMPTADEAEELINNTDITYPLEGNAGYVKLANKSDNSIYIILPNTYDSEYSYNSSYRNLVNLWCSDRRLRDDYYRVTNLHIVNKYNEHGARIIYSDDTYGRTKLYNIRGVISPNATEEITAQHYNSIPAAKVALSGDYNDLTNKPTIPTVPSNENATSGGTTLSVVTTGDKYNWNNKANVWRGTQAQYDALSPNYDSNTIYIITAS